MSDIGISKNDGIWIILTGEHNMHEDVALHRGGRNALTISGQQALSQASNRSSQSSKNNMHTWDLTCFYPHKRQNVGISMPS